jgi:hypothetical protein
MDTDYRLRSIEERIDTRFAQFELRFEQRFARFESEMLRAMAGLVKWIVGTAIALGVAGITVMSFVLNNAVPKAAPAPPPIVINLPAPSAPVR